MPCTAQPRRQALAAGENLLGDHVQRPAARAPLDAPGGGRDVLQHVEVLRGIEQPVGMIDADAGDPFLAQQARQQLVNRLEHRRVFDAQAGQRVDVEEAAVVDLVRRGPPVRQPVRLLLEQLVQRVERVAAARACR